MNYQPLTGQRTRNRGAGWRNRLAKGRGSVRALLGLSCLTRRRTGNSSLGVAALDVAVRSIDVAGMGAAVSPVKVPLGLLHGATSSSVAHGQEWYGRDSSASRPSAPHVMNGVTRRVKRPVAERYPRQLLPEMLQEGRVAG